MNRSTDADYIQTNRILWAVATPWWIGSIYESYHQQLSNSQQMNSSTNYPYPLNWAERPYFTEAAMGNMLRRLFPAGQWIHDKPVPESGIKGRPDYRSWSLKMIVEFDGFLHFTRAETQRRDRLKNVTYRNMGYRVIRIPYYVQPSRDVQLALFGKVDEAVDGFERPHGFADKKAVRPDDFNIEGLRLLEQSLMELRELGLNEVADEVSRSMRDEMEDVDSTETVMFG